MRNPVPQAYRLPAILVAYSTLLLGGVAYRLFWFSQGAAHGGDARLSAFAQLPVPILAHIIFGTVFVLVGAFQFSEPLRRRAPKMHRRLGRGTTIAGIIAGFSTSVAVLVYPTTPDSNAAGDIVRFTAGLAWSSALILGVFFATRRQFVKHRVWMMRGYAIATFGNTQTVLLIVLAIVSVDPTPALATATSIAGLVINLGFVEWIRRPSAISQPPQLT